MIGGEGEGRERQREGISGRENLGIKHPSAFSLPQPPFISLG